MGALSGLTAEVIGQLPATRIKALTMADIAGLTAAQLPGLTAPQLALFNPVQLLAFTKAQIPFLTPAAIAGLAPGQIGMLTPQQVVAQPEGGGAYVFLQLVPQPQGRSLQDVAAADLSQSGLQFVEGSETRVNGLPAFVGTFRGQLQNMGDVVLRSAWISHNGQVFRLAGLSGTGAYRQLQQAVDASVRSFEPLSAGEAERIRPNVIELHTAKAGDTWQSLAAGPGRNVIKPETLAIMNGYPAQERPQAGDRIKIVVEGR